MNGLRLSGSARMPTLYMTLPASAARRRGGRRAVPAERRRRTLAGAGRAPWPTRGRGRAAPPTRNRTRTGRTCRCWFTIPPLIDDAPAAARLVSPAARRRSPLMVSHARGVASIMGAPDREANERALLGLHPGEHRESRYDAVIFDLDGVVTQTAAVHAAAWKRLFDAYLAERAARTGTSPGGASARGDVPARCGRSTSRPTTGSTWTASRATTASATSSPRAASSCRWATRPTRRSARRSAGSATARTTSSTPRCGSTASRPSPPRSRSSTSCATPGSGSASCRRARTPPWCSTSPARRTCSRCAWTAWWPRRWACPASPTRRCTSRRRAGWGSTRRAPSSSRTRSPASRPAGAAGSAS